MEDQREIRITNYPNGNIKSKITYKSKTSDVKDGEALHYYENGQLEEKRIYKDGKENGEYLWYHENGQLRSKGSLKDGLQDGEFNTYYEDGSIEAVLICKDGKFIKGERY